MTEDNQWAQLVSLSDLDSEPIPITTNKIVFGRGADCGACLLENKVVSSHHCFIEKDEAGLVTLNDTRNNYSIHLSPYDGMCRPEQSAWTAQADLVYTLRRCVSPQLHFGASLKMCRHVPTVSKGSYDPGRLLKTL